MTAIEKNALWNLPPQRSLPAVVAEHIIEAIRTGKLKPGERLVEMQLAKNLGVSRGPLREALKTLEASRVVETRRGRGTYVVQYSTAEIMQMVALRATLEGLAARLVVERLTPEMLEKLTGLTREMGHLAKAGMTSEWRELDWRFHEEVCASSGNRFLLMAWQSISTLVRLFLHNHPSFERDIPKVLSNHDFFLAALASRDPDKAEQTFRGLILQSAFSRFELDIPPALASIVDAAETAFPRETKMAEAQSALVAAKGRRKSAGA